MPETVIGMKVIYQLICLLTTVQACRSIGVTYLLLTAHPQEFVLDYTEEQDVREISPRCGLILSHGTILEPGALVSVPREE